MDGERVSTAAVVVVDGKIIRTGDDESNDDPQVLIVFPQALGKHEVADTIVVPS